MRILVKFRLVVATAAVAVILGACTATTATTTPTTPPTTTKPQEAGWTVEGYCGDFFSTKPNRTVVPC